MRLITNIIIFIVLVAYCFSLKMERREKSMPHSNNKEYKIEGELILKHDTSSEYCIMTVKGKRLRIYDNEVVEVNGIEVKYKNGKFCTCDENEELKVHVGDTIKIRNNIL